ncbi:MAG: outer membrane protein assembly factor BamD [Thiotrichaceae bacterium]
MVTRLQQVIKFFLIFVVLSSVSGCSFFEERDETEGWSAQKIYNEAKDYFNSGDYERAIKYYEILEARYPFERLTQQAQLDVIYAYYRYEEPESAIAAADRFIKQYPRHPFVDYSYYMKGLINFERNISPLDKIFPVDKSQRDTKTEIAAFSDFATLVKLFPKSKYSQDARQRMIFLRNNLAMNEVHVANFYIKRGAYVAAVNRAKIVLEKYQGTPAVPESLIILAKCYKIMGMTELLQSTLRVFKQNYPTHRGLKEIDAVVVDG